MNIPVIGGSVMANYGTLSSRPPMQNAVARMNHLGDKRRPFLFIIDYEMNKPYVFELDDLVENDIEVSIEGRSYTPVSSHEYPDAIRLVSHPITYERYLEAFRSIHRHFILGNTYLANLTFPTRIDTNLGLRGLYGLSDARYKLRFADRFVCYSPEAFVTIEQNAIASFPMKGTIDADVPNAEDKILANEKETAEHITIVDLIRNDIGIIATGVSVPRFRYIDRIETSFRRLLQVSSEIRGTLEPEWPARIGTILSRLLPAGSICGAPKRKTVAVIAEAEIDERGYYTGVFGVFDGIRLRAGVMIRFVERSDSGELLYRSGGGLTVYSDPESEYQEMIDKIYVPAVGNHSVRSESVQEPNAPRDENAEVEKHSLRY